MIYKHEQKIKVGKKYLFFKHIFTIVRQKNVDNPSLEGTVICFDNYVKDNQHGRSYNPEKSLRIKINGKYYAIERWIIETNEGRKTFGYMPVEIILYKRNNDNSSIRERQDFILDNRPTALTDNYQYWIAYTDSIYMRDSVEKKYECPLFLERKRYEEHKIKLLLPIHH